MGATGGDVGCGATAVAVGSGDAAVPEGSGDAAVPAGSGDAAVPAGSGEASVPLNAAIAEFLTSLRASKPSPHTVAAYEADLRLIAALLGPDIEQLTTADLTARRLRAAFARYADTHAKASVARAWSTWNRFCTHLALDDTIAANPMSGVGRTKVPAAAPHAFSQADIDALIDTLAHGRIPARRPWPERDYAIITTLAVTGLRRAELLALAIDDAEGQPGARQIAVRHGKGDKYRAIPVDPRLEPVLAAYLASRWARYPAKGRRTPADPWSAPPRAAMWLNDRGTAMTAPQLRHLVERAYRAAGINSHRPAGALVHALRHTFATALIENGASAIEVMSLLGHASLTTTTRYLATRPDQLRAAVSANPAYARLER